MLGREKSESSDWIEEQPLPTCIDCMISISALKLLIPKHDLLADVNSCIS